MQCFACFLLLVLKCIKLKLESKEFVPSKPGCGTEDSRETESREPEAVIRKCLRHTHVILKNTSIYAVPMPFPGHLQPLYKTL